MDSWQEAAFELFVHEHGHVLLRTAVLLTGDRGHGEDLFQTTLERTARRWERIEGPPLAFARTVLVNLATDRWRRRGARVAEVPLDPAHDVPILGGTTEVELRHTLGLALRGLTPRQRAVMVLRYYADLSEADIAATLGVSVGSVKNTASQARARLRTSLEGQESLR